MAEDDGRAGQTAGVAHAAGDWCDRETAKAKLGETSCIAGVDAAR